MKRYIRKGVICDAMSRWTGELTSEIADEIDDDMLRRRVLRAAGVGASTLVAGCFDQNGGNGDGSPNGTDDGSGEPSGEIHWLMDYNAEPWQKRWETLKKQYEEEHPDVSIKMEYVGFAGNSGQRLQQLLQSGDPPELFQGTMAEMGLLVGGGRAIHVNDVNDTIREFYDDDIRFIHTVKANGSAEWMVPHGWQTISTFTYRSDIYDQLSLSVPETWDDLLNNAQAIDEDGSIDERGFGLAGQKTGKSEAQFDCFFRSAGGYYYEEVDGEIEVWFPEDIAIETLEYLQQLAEYSIDPSQLSFGPTIKGWLGRQFAQCTMASSWLVDVAFDSGQNDLATSTKMAVLPTPNADDEPLDRGSVLIDGTPILKGSNIEAAKDWLTWLYAEDKERTANSNLMNLRIFPSTDTLFESDVYQNGESLQRGDGYMLEAQKKVRELAETMEHPDRPSSLATNYVGRFPITEEMMNQVLVAGANPSEAVAEAKSRFEERLAEGKERVADVDNEYSG